MKKNLTYLLPVVLLASYVAGYSSAIHKLLVRWDSGNDNYCYLVIPVFLYLLWEKRDVFCFQKFTYSLWGVFAALIAMVVILLGEAGSSETVVYFALWIGLVSIFLTFYGSRLRSLIFPFVILLFIVPLPAFLINVLTFKMKMISSVASVDLLRFAGISVVQEGNIIDLGLDRLQVADACSGLRFFIPMVIIGLLCGHFFTKGIWKRLVVLLLVAPLSILINVVRIFGAGIAVAWGHAEFATSFLHDVSGWVVFVFAAIILSMTAYFLGMIGGQKGRRAGKLTGTHEEPYNEAISVRTRDGLDYAVAVCVIFFISGVALSQVSSVIRYPKRQSFDAFPMQIGQWEGTRAYISDEVLRSLWSDDYVSASFRKKGSVAVIHLLIPYYKYQKTQHTAHAPQSCLLGGGWTLISSSPYPVDVKNGRINVMVMSLEKDNQIMLAGYFFLGRGRVVTSPIKNKIYLLKDSMMKRRSDGAVVRVELIPSDNQTLEQAHMELASFITQLWPMLHSYIPD